MSKADSKPAEDMSMEEILASIRKLMAQDQDVMDPARANREAGLPSEDPTVDDEVLELIEELPEDGVIVDETSIPADSPPHWNEPPQHHISGATAELAGEPLDLDTEFSVKEGAPPVETAAAPPAADPTSWASVDSARVAHEPIMVGLEILPDAGEPLAEPAPPPRFIDEGDPPVIADTATFDEPDDSLVDPAATGLAETANDTVQIPHEEVAAMDAPQERILSPEAAVKTSAAFDALAQTLISGYEGDSNTLEGVVRAMLKPLLKEWLDANLPSIVENIVQTEIRRLSR